MNKGRRSLFVIFGRLFQSIPPICFRWIEFFLRKKEINHYPMIALISAPRSGSTLTYQILSRGTKSFYLTNLWNLFFSIPLIGGILSRRKRSTSNFISNRGLVKGLYGESEGLKFWTYWTGQGLEETNQKVSFWRVNYIRKVFGKLLEKEKVMITGYLGHSLCINKMRDMFPGIVFIYLKRDKLSNIYSMYKTGQDFFWFSLKPFGWKDSLKLSLHERYVWQYNTIVDKIEKELSNEDTFQVDYSSVCENPKFFLSSLQKFCKKKDINLELCLEEIPEKFQVSKVLPSQDKDAKIFSDIINNE